jgi:hypothetical protein
MVHSGLADVTVISIVIAFAKLVPPPLSLTATRYHTNNCSYRHLQMDNKPQFVVFLQSVAYRPRSAAAPPRSEIAHWTWRAGDGTPELQATGVPTAAAITERSSTHHDTSCAESATTTPCACELASCVHQM